MTGRRERVDVEHLTGLPPAEVFARLSDHERLGPLFRARITLLDPGDPALDGLGAVRRVRIGPLPPFEETVTVAVPEQLVEYRISRGRPLRGHLGRIEIHADPRGSRVHYVVEFGSEPAVVARIVAAALRRTIPAGLRQVLPPPEVTA